jgi:hypothetical protein
MRVKLAQRRVEAIDSEDKQRISAYLAGPEYALQVRTRFGDSPYGPNSAQVRAVLAALNNWQPAVWISLAEREIQFNGMMFLDNPFWPTLSHDRSEVRSRAYTNASSQREVVRTGEQHEMDKFWRAASQQASEIFLAVLNGNPNPFPDQPHAQMAWQGAKNLAAAYVFRAWLDESDFAKLSEPYRGLPDLPS